MATVISVHPGFTGFGKMFSTWKWQGWPPLSYLCVAPVIGSPPAMVLEIELQGCDPGTMGPGPGPGWGPELMWARLLST